MNTQADLDAYASSPAHKTQVIAERLESLAALLRDRGKAFGQQAQRPYTVRSTPTATAAQIVNDFTNGIGNIGSYLHDLITDATLFEIQLRDATIIARDTTQG